MGSKCSTSSPPSLHHEQWQQVALPFGFHWKISQGRYTLMENLLSRQRVERYIVSFDGEKELEEYLSSIDWRNEEQHLVQAKFVEYTREGESICRGRLKAIVYLTHIPHRLSTIALPLGQGLYLISAALIGFRVIFNVIGGFRPSEDMVGIDSQGKVRVWMNSNFSCNYLYGPYYIEKRIDGGIDGSEEGLVSEVLSMVQKKIDFHLHSQDIPKVSTFLGDFQGLTFQIALKGITAYSFQFAISIPKCLSSLLRFRSGYTPSSRQPRFSAQSQELVPQVDPDFGGIREEPRMESHMGIEKEGLIDSAGEIEPKNNKKTQYSFFLRSTSKCEPPSRPKVNFIYSTSPNPYFTLPIKTKESRAARRRVTFTDKDSQHFLDQELVIDMGKYLM